MKTKIRKIFAAAMASVMMIVFAGCGNDKNGYESLKTDIIGVWCDTDGPEYVENNGSPYYRLYEFTSDGRIIYHMPQDLGSVYSESNYEIRDDFLDVDGSLCKISIENDILTMTNNAGSSQYRRMSLEEVCDYGVVCIDNELYQQQLVILGMADGTDESAEETSASDWE